MNPQIQLAQRTSERHRQILFWLIRFLIILTIVVELQTNRTSILFLNFFVFILTFFPTGIRVLFRIVFPLPLEFVYLISLLAIVVFEKIFIGAVVQLILGMFFGLFGFLLLYILYYNSRVKSSYPLVALFSFCFSVAIGALWEIFLYLLFTFISFRVGELDVKDSTLALLWLTIGAGLSSLGGLLFLRYGEHPGFQKLLTMFIRKNPQLFIQDSSSEYIFELIQKGESETLEFKSTLRTNLHTKQHDKKIEYALLKTVTAFLNSTGGIVLVGIADDGGLIGINRDGFMNSDQFYRHFTTLIKEYIGNEFLPFIKSGVVTVEGCDVLKIECDPSSRPVFLQSDLGEEFYIRSGPASVRLEGRKLLAYVHQRFK